MGIAILGSVVGVGYVAHLNLSGLSGPAASAVRQSVFSGVAVAQRLHSASLLTSVRTAFIHGMDMALFVSAGISLMGVVLSLLFLPKTNVSKPAALLGADEEAEVVGTDRGPQRSAV